MKFIILIGCCFVLSSCASLQSNKSPYDNQPWANYPSPNDSPMMDSPDGSRAWPSASGPNTVDSVRRFPSSWFKWQK